MSRSVLFRVCRSRNGTAAALALKIGRSGSRPTEKTTSRTKQEIVHQMENKTHKGVSFGKVGSIREFHLMLSTGTCLAVVSHTAGWKPIDVPNPIVEPERAGRPGVLRSQICDPDNILSKSSKDVIEGLINGLDAHAQVAVLVIKKINSEFINGNAGRSVEDSAEEFSRAVHNKWKLGDEKKQDGVLLFLSVEDRTLYISAGRGVLEIVTESDLTFIIDDMKEELRAGNHGKAIERGVVALDLLLSGDPKFRGRYSGRKGGDGGGGFLNNDTAKRILFILLLAFAASLTSSSSKESSLESGRNKLDRLANEVSQSEIEDVYQPRSCPICMEDYPVADKRTYYDSRQINKESASDQAANKGNKNKLSVHRPMALQCGHVFCWSCLDKNHLKTPQGGDRCPICQESITISSTGTDTDSTTDVLQPQVQDEMYRTNPSYFANKQDWVRWRNREFYYRINRLNEVYPEAVPEESKTRMEETLRRSETDTSSSDTDHRKTTTTTTTTTTATVMDFVKVASARTAEIDRIISDRKALEIARRSGSQGSSSSRSSGSGSGSGSGSSDSDEAVSGGGGGSSAGGQGGSW